MISPALVFPLLPAKKVEKGNGKGMDVGNDSSIPHFLRFAAAGFDGKRIGVFTKCSPKDLCRQTRKHLVVFAPDPAIFPETVVRRQITFCFGN